MRSKRSRPLLDDKAIVAWNGLTILGLVSAGRLDLAERCADTILGFERTLGTLPRYIWHGEAKGEGFLEDYAFFAQALLALGRFEEGMRVGEEMITRFYDEDSGGFFATGKGHENLFGRPKPVLDQPIPSANSAAIRVLFEMGETDRALYSLAAFRGWMDHAPMACEGLFVAATDITFSETTLEVHTWSYSEGRFEIILAFQLLPGWSIPIGGLEVLVGDQPLSWNGEPKEIDGVDGVALFGEFDEQPETILIRYQPCTDRLCLPVREVEWLLDATDVL